MRSLLMNIRGDCCSESYSSLRRYKYRMHAEWTANDPDTVTRVGARETLEQCSLSATARLDVRSGFRL